jgi:hypothetical protein
MPEQTNRAEDDALLNKVLQRSATDKAFRNTLISQPERAIEEIIGVPVSSLSKPVRVKFVEKAADLDALVVLPDYVDPDGVLSDAELEAVAGGDWCITSCSLSITICRNTDDNKICVGT